MAVTRMTFPDKLAVPVKDVLWMTLVGDVLATDELLRFSVILYFDALFNKCNTVLYGVLLSNSGMNV